MIRNYAAGGGDPEGQGFWREMSGYFATGGSASQSQVFTIQCDFDPKVVFSVYAATAELNPSGIDAVGTQGGFSLKSPGTVGTVSGAIANAMIRSIITISGRTVSIRPLGPNAGMSSTSGQTAYFHYKIFGTVQE